MALIIQATDGPPLVIKCHTSTASHMTFDNVEEMLASSLRCCFDFDSITQSICYWDCMPLPGLIIPFFYPCSFLTVTSG